MKKRLRKSTKKSLIINGIVYLTLIVAGILLLVLPFSGNGKFNAFNWWFPYVGFFIYISGMSFPLYLITTKEFNCPGWAVFLGGVLTLGLSATVILITPKVIYGDNIPTLIFLIVVAAILAVGCIVNHVIKYLSGRSDYFSIVCCLGIIYTVILIILHRGEGNHYNANESYPSDEEREEAYQAELKLENIYYHVKTNVEVTCHGLNGKIGPTGLKLYDYSIDVEFVFRNGKGDERSKSTSFSVEDDEFFYFDAKDAESRYEYVLKPSDINWHGDWMF